MIDVEGLAAELFEAEQRATSVPLLSARYPEMDRPTARRIARANDALSRRHDGDLVGWKLGWTSAAMREALGIDQPNWGSVWGRHVLDDAAPIARFVHPKVEPELVYRPDRKLAGQPTAEDVAAAPGAWALGLEVVDPRFPSFDFTALDNTADNSSRAGIRTGAFVPLAAERLDRISVTFAHGDAVRSGCSDQTMGSPAAAVAWLVARLDEEGSSLEAGQLVYTGGLTAPFNAVSGSTFELRSDELGEIGLRFD